MYNPATRLLTVLEVDQRSVRRYVTMLQDMGVPIVGERGRHGGYRLRPGFKLPPLMLTDEEALAVVLGLLAARQLGLAAAAPAVEGALAKLDRVLPAGVREQVDAVQESVVFDLPPGATLPDGAVLRAFGTAVRQSRRLWIRYRSWRDLSERAIDPYGLVFRLGAWYAAGWCHLRSDLRVFRLERVQAVRLLEETFERPADFDARRHVHHALATMPDTWTVEVVLETTVEEARRRLSPIWGTLEPAPEGVLLRCNIGNLDRMAHHLLGLPWPVAVRRPPELVDAFRGMAERAAAVAERW